jgi:cytosine/adenosine deaminase-related metal-dependent hydrolase
MIWARSVAFVNGRIVADGGLAESVRVSSRVLSIGERPRPGDAVVDLDGAFVMPGLINAHDHLELNHYGRLKGRERYDNASQWFADLRPRLSSDAKILAARAHPLVDRLFIGALKNLLSGVTLVAHHNPFYQELRRAMPIRILRRFGWAHSFFLEGQPAGARGEPGGQVAARWQSTAAALPFFVHLGEGTDAAAASELPRLESLGCLAANTVLIHGVAIDRAGWQRVAAAGAAVVWCPASNDFLFGRTVDVRDLMPGRGQLSVRVALGTDSRISGARDLLAELRVALAAVEVPRAAHGLQTVPPITAAHLFAMVTRHAADILRMTRAGRIAAGFPADLIVIPPRADTAAESLLAVDRRDLRLVMVDGRPLVGDPVLSEVFGARQIAARPLCVDGTGKLADASLVRRIASSPIGEPGVSVA